MVEPSPGRPRVRVELHELEGGYEGHKDFANEAAKRLEAALNSVELQRAVENGKFSHTRRRTSAEILAEILNAREVHGPGGTDGVVDLRLRTITEQDGSHWLEWCEPGSRVGTIGIDGGGTGVVATCPQHLEAWSARKDYASLAGHMMHEYMHILDYSHAGPGKYKSAAYRIGDLVEEAVNGEL